MALHWANTSSRYAPVIHSPVLTDSKALSENDEACSACWRDRETRLQQSTLPGVTLLKQPLVPYCQYKVGRWRKKRALCICLLCFVAITWPLLHPESFHLDFSRLLRRHWFKLQPFSIQGKGKQCRTVDTSILPCTKVAQHSWSTYTQVTTLPPCFPALKENFNLKSYDEIWFEWADATPSGKKKKKSSKQKQQK